MPKKILAVSVNHERFEDLSKAAHNMGMTRSRYINMVIDKGTDVTAPVEILHIYELLHTIKDANMPAKTRKELVEQVDKLLAIKVGKENDNG